MAKEGTIAPTATYTRGGGAGADIGDQVADDKLLDLFAEGNTLVLQGLHRLWPPIIAFASELRAEITHPVQVNAYLTPRAAQGFAHHYDVHDVFVLQVSGVKRWQVHPPVLTDPLRTQPWTEHRAAVSRASTEEALIDTLLEPGDALYLPRGYIHGAQAQAGVSAHLTVGVHSVTRFSIVEALVAAAANDPDLRTSLPLGIDLADTGGAVAAEVRATIAALSARLDRTQTADAADRLRRLVWAQARPAPIQPINTAIAMAAMDDQSVIALRPHLDVHLGRHGGRLSVETGTHTLDLDPSAAPTLVTLQTGRRLRIADFPDLEPDVSRELARQLLRAGIAVLV